ncbi:dimethylarginine dimethylaminohydrolase family protein [Bacillus halotolerans]|uniref:Dimethylarginine dimethylaminohydrolase family protein n=1 Tax=Bacillus halotolerans TaxID=260554 RepID=A0ABY7I6E6_9BACI|nr:dimethylarginine dimethylaminohydrolase family protein [Bacillus halotolerans]MDG0765872.1 dimethylarginine dimethylaminohydrolase family protein [Bacillus halotolerans]UUI85693.1 dimethylarginine dimethylaminohydrolase family protein [Bacillus halotolerans]WAT22695.1 dimethylarginine dimethylaminohydrolase family protein [Bacillus halotolerans]
MDVSVPKHQHKTVCQTEYDTLKKVILCKPEHMTIKDVINETQKHFEEDNIQVKTAKEQHKRLVEELRSHSIEVILLPVQHGLPEQVFTRDIGFVIGEKAFLSSMTEPIRQGEEPVIKEFFHNQGIPYTRMLDTSIEGGDVVIDGDTVYVGISQRTDISAVGQLQEELPEYTITPVPLHEKFLHLDCVFNIISESEALIYPEALPQQEVDMLAERYNLIEVPENEQFTLGTNVLSIGRKTIISLPGNRHVNRELSKRGYHIIEIDLSEIIKSGGSFRCCTMPLIRGE